MNKKLLRWEVISMVAVILSGTALHFTFEWLHRATPVALIAAVNESSWEHLKLAFWPTLIMSLVMFAILRKEIANFWLGQMLNLLVTPLLILGIFYLYLWLAGSDNLIVDISDFIISVMIGHLISLKICSLSPLPRLTKWLGGVIIIFLLVCFSSFTYFPPQNFLFRDPINGQYGIARE